MTHKYLINGDEETVSTLSQRFTAENYRILRSWLRSLDLEGISNLQYNLDRLPVDDFERHSNVLLAHNTNLQDNLNRLPVDDLERHSNVLLAQNIKSHSQKPCVVDQDFKKHCIVLDHDLRI